MRIEKLDESTKKNLQLVPNFFMFLLLFATLFTKEFTSFMHNHSLCYDNILALINPVKYQKLVNSQQLLDR